MPRFVGAIDQGTSATRFALVDRDGRIAALERREHAQITPRPGWVEHDPLEILAATRAVIDAALAGAGAARGEVAAIGIANQRETAVLWERESGAPVHNAIVWQDTRTGALVRALAGAAGPDRLRASVGLPLSTYFSGPKLTWMLDAVPGARGRAERGELLAGTVDAWLLWNLTGGPAGGVHATDVTNASRTLLMDLRDLAWHPPALELMGIPAAILPRIGSSSERYGELTATAASGVAVAGILGDQQAALFGQACFERGEAKCTHGTGSFLLVNTGADPVPSEVLLTTVAHRIAGEGARYALEGSIAVTGALVQWLRDRLGIIERSEQIEELARSVPDNGGVWFVPAFSGLFAPHWREDARGLIGGLTAHAGRGHIARAALEATAWQTREVADAVARALGAPLAELRVDGGMSANELLMALQADVLGVPVVRPAVTETTALGAAFAAGLAVGFWRDRHELRERWVAERRWTPTLDPATREREYARWRRAVSRSLDWA